NIFIVYFLAPDHDFAVFDASRSFYDDMLIFFHFLIIGIEVIDFASPLKSHSYHAIHFYTSCTATSNRSSTSCEFTWARSCFCASMTSSNARTQWAASVLVAVCL